MGIDINLVHDFSKSLSYDEVENDILNKYRIKNILRDEDDNMLYTICVTLLQDYEYRLANYKAYIGVGMNLRLLMELRNTAIQKLTNEELKQFDDCHTPLEVVNRRAKVMHRFANDDVVEPWQLFYISLRTLDINNLYRGSEIEFKTDFEECYDDGDFDKALSRDDLLSDFAWNMRKKSGAIHKTYAHPY